MYLDATGGKSRVSCRTGLLSTQGCWAETIPQNFRKHFHNGTIRNEVLFNLPGVNTSSLLLSSAAEGWVWARRRGHSSTPGRQQRLTAMPPTANRTLSPSGSIATCLLECSWIRVIFVEPGGLETVSLSCPPPLVTLPIVYPVSLAWSLGQQVEACQEQKEMDGLRGRNNL